MTTIPRATKIMILRHAEKPVDSGSKGVSSSGEEDPESLIIQGWVRAGALACLLAPTSKAIQNPELAQPQFLYASGIGKHDNSSRPQQTITPLNERLGLSINTDYLKGHENAMVANALACDGVVLICWQHQEIPKIANQIVDNVTTVPQQWLENRFDLIWVFDLNPTSGRYSFKQVPQCLLALDLSTPM